MYRVSMYLYMFGTSCLSHLSCSTDLKFAASPSALRRSPDDVVCRTARWGGDWKAGHGLQDDVTFIGYSIDDVGVTLSTFVEMLLVGAEAEVSDGQLLEGLERLK